MSEGEIMKGMSLGWWKVNEGAGKEENVRNMEI